MNLSGRTLIPSLVFVAAAYFFYRVHEMLLPFVLAGVIAYLFNPLVRFFEVRGLRRRPIVIVLFVSVMSILTLSSYKLALVAASEAAKASRDMPQYVQKGSEMFAFWRAHTRVNHALVDYVAEHGRAWPQEILSKMPSFAMGIFPAIEIAFLVPFIGFFFIQEGPRMRDYLLRCVPSRYVEMVLGLMVEIDNSLGKYVRGILLEALCVGCLALAGFWAIDLDYALQIAIVVGLGNVIPYVGPVVGAVLGGGVAIFQWGSAVGVLKVLVVCGLVRFIEDWFIQTTVMRRAVHLHPVVIVFSLMAGAKLFGFWGLLFAVPVASMTKVLLDVLWPWYRSQYGLVNPPHLPEVNRVPLI
jgi:predicted PurR-regulated permease PerM